MYILYLTIQTHLHYKEKAGICIAKPSIDKFMNIISTNPNLNRKTRTLFFVHVFENII